MAAPPPEIVVNAYSTGWLKRGFPWVYPAEVVRGSAAPGTVVSLRGEGGTALGLGVADRGWIAVRRFRRDEGPVDAGLIGARVSAAARRRLSIGPQATAYRLVNAENDDLAGIRVDVWGRVVVVAVDSPSLRALGESAGLAARDELGNIDAVWLSERRDPRDVDRATGAPRCVFGDAAILEVVVHELGLAYEVRPALGKDAGLFTDMRDNRAWMARHWHGTRVLNLFAHTGAFSVSARRHGAGEVVSVDLSEGHLARARRNFALNELDAGELLAEDCFRVLDRFRRQGRRFDRVVVDPPGYSHSDAGTWQGEKDWARLSAASLRVLEPGGWLIAASNLGTQSPKQFGGALQEGAERAGRELRLCHEGTPGVDHPAALHFPESRYLKFWVMEAGDVA
ncbi:MAG: class I SAM-dependent rRNA methyltransferase [Myxococcales bacterium]|nr:class I SAM-dependent rRNA methyltransferase [Myxococcales bacterium]